MFSQKQKDFNILQEIARVRKITIKMMGCRKQKCVIQPGSGYGHHRKIFIIVGSSNILIIAQLSQKKTLTRVKIYFQKYISNC